MRLKTAIMSLLLVGADLGVYVSLDVLFVLRGVAGLLEGLMLGAMIVVTIGSSHPDRLNGIFWGVAALPMAGAAYLLPVWIVPHFGADGGFATLAVFALISAIAAWFLIDQGPATVRADTVRARWCLPTLLTLAAVFLGGAANGGSWGYLQVLADEHEFSLAIAAISISGGLVAQVLGAFAASLVSGRLPFRAAPITQSSATADRSRRIPAGRPSW